MQTVGKQWGVSDAPRALLGAGATRIEQRVQMAVLLGDGWPASTTARSCAGDRTTVWRWARRWAAGGAGRDRDRSGRPVVLTEAVRSVAFYCQVAPLPGCRRWSYRWAERYVTAHPEAVGRGISRSSLQRVLASQALAPHRHKYFLHITDPDFFPNMESLIDLYLHPPEYLFWVLPDPARVDILLRRRKLELGLVNEQQAESKEREVAIAVGATFQHLDLVVETFQRSGGDGVIVPGENGLDV